MSRIIRSTKFWLVGAVVAASLAGTAYATIPGGDGVIHACYTKSGGTLRVIDASVTKCKSTETSLDWSQRGLPGPKGDPGEPGPPGPQGEQGNPGSAGPGARWAEVTTIGPDATIAAQSGGFSITSEATGTFTLDTGASTQGKAALASIRPDASGDGATVQVRKSGETEVLVRTYNSVGSVISESFTVVVL
jgi:hypothetical protein